MLELGICESFLYLDSYFFTSTTSTRYHCTCVAAVHRRCLVKQRTVSSWRNCCCLWLWHGQLLSLPPPGADYDCKQLARLPTRRQPLLSVTSFARVIFVHYNSNAGWRCPWKSAAEKKLCALCVSALTNLSPCTDFNVIIWKVDFVYLKIC